MDTEPNINDKCPTNTTYCEPISDIKNPPTAAPIVVPTLHADINNPLAKSGASGAEDIIQFDLYFLLLQLRFPKLR